MIKFANIWLYNKIYRTCISKDFGCFKIIFISMFLTSLMKFIKVIRFMNIEKLIDYLIM